jgi:glycosyltransferase involved in cell wall biosynthesis
VEHFRRKAEARLGNRVEVVKWLPPERVPNFINASDIGVIPLVREKDYNRAKSPTKLFEFMACGKPCVSSPVGEIPGIVEHGENGLLARNLESFVEGIRGLFENPGARMKMGIRARRTIEQRYSLDSCAGRYLRELRDNRLIEDLQIVSDTGGKDPGKENGK